MAESKEELKNLLMRVKKESEKAGLKPNIKTNKQTKIMTSGLITSWKIKGGKVAWHSAAHGAVQSQTPLGD